MPRDLNSMWPQLKPSAQQALCHAAAQLIERHSGVIELHCLQGGVRLVRTGKEWKPGDFEYKLGDDVDD